MLVHVAVPVPALDLLTYSVPDQFGRAAVGARAVVPLGARVVTGIVVEVDVDAGSAARGIKPIRQLLDAESFVPPELIALARWTAEYYACGVGDTIPALLPPMARGARVDAHKTVRMFTLTALGREALQTDAAARPLTSRQREALDSFVLLVKRSDHLAAFGAQPPNLVVHNHQFVVVP